jgi:hypothetical protein
MAKRVVRREWTAQDERALKKHSKEKTPVGAISKALKRTPGALRQKARVVGAQLATFSDTGQPRMASSTTLSSCFLPTPLLACTAKPELIVMR